jgi:Mce-associated membrane protein
VADDTARAPQGRTAAGPTADPASGGTATDVVDAPARQRPTPKEEPTGTDAPRRRGLRRGRRGQAAGERASRRLSLPLVPVLAVLLALLVAGCVVLWVTRPAASAVRTDAYVGALQAARAGIVDVASFDYVTLDDDIRQIRNVTTGDLQKESVDQLDQRRQQITAAQAVVHTTVVGAAVGKADESAATVFAVIQSTQKTSTSQQAQVQRYRVEIQLQRVDGRWLLSGITGR